ncbi:unnamed protein product [Lymnaea stagnalis]|uniref:Uncharacterized protein n=1 Tax=Lymnaea stagnalis TaxID=6523 RepID=A0AAV2I718_LYMST
MAKPKDDDDPFVNYVAKMRFSKEMINKENMIHRRTWPCMWGYILPIYNELNTNLDQGERRPMPSKVKRVDPEEFAHMWPDPESRMTKNFKPSDSIPPSSNNKMYGWKVGKGIVEPTDKWVKPRSRYNMYKDLGWGDDSLW